MKTYSIQMTSILSGVSPDCIRAWERRYGAINPERDKGRRIFNDEDVGRLLMLKELSSLGNPISSVAKLSDQELTQLCTELGLQLSGKIINATIPHKDSTACLEYILLALGAQRFDILLHELNKAADEFNARDFSVGVMSHVVEAFFHSGLSDLKKEALFGIIKSVVLKKLLLHSNGESNVVIGFVGDKKNELKALLASLILVHNGKRVAYFEINHRLDVLLEAGSISQAKILYIETGADSKNLSFYRERLQSSSWSGHLILGGVNSQDAHYEESGIKISMVNGLVPLEEKLKNL